MLRRHGTRLAVAVAIEGTAVVVLAWRAERMTDRLERRGRDLARTGQENAVAAVSDLVA